MESLKLWVIRPCLDGTALLTGLTFLRAVLHVLPISGPFLAPFEFTLAALANFGSKTIFNFCLHG